jgi:hypothetical protein
LFGMFEPGPLVGAEPPEPELPKFPNPDPELPLDPELPKLPKLELLPDPVPV